MRVAVFLIETSTPGDRHIINNLKCEIMETKIQKWLQRENKFFTIMSYGHRISNGDVVLMSGLLIALCVLVSLSAWLPRAHIRARFAASWRTRARSPSPCGPSWRMRCWHPEGQTGGKIRRERNKGMSNSEFVTLRREELAELKKLPDPYGRF